MRIRNILAIIALLLSLTLPAQENRDTRIKVNAGFKVGFHAATYNKTDFEIDGYEFNERIIQSNKIGYSASPFIRIIKGKYYMQTEATLSLTRHYFEFNNIRPEETMQESAENTPEYKLTTFCIQVPVLFGYEFLQSGHYAMSVFTGPNTKFVFTAHDKQEFNHFRYNDLQELLRSTIFYWRLGLGVKISNVCFDFTYDIGLNNNTRGIESIKSGKRFSAQRSDNLLSFSVGIIF